MPPLNPGRRVATAAIASWLVRPAAAATAINGAGATFPFPVYAEWANVYRRETGIVIDYKPVGSGAGLARIQAGEVDFGGSDVPLSADELSRHQLLQFPALVGGVVPVLNIKGIAPGELVLDGAVLADIYLGRVRHWNDPAITALNPTLSLPPQNITVVHRSEASGTTALWSDYLAQASAEWRSTVGTGTSLVWPLGASGTGNEGVASYVQRTRVSLGYVEYAYAKLHHLSHAALRAADGSVRQPGIAAFEAAAWPITGRSYVLLSTRPERAARSLEVVRFFDWAFKHGRETATALDYAFVAEAERQSIGRAWREQIRGAAGVLGP